MPVVVVVVVVSGFSDRVVFAEGLSVTVVTVADECPFIVVSSFVDIDIVVLSRSAVVVGIVSVTVV